MSSNDPGSSVPGPGLESPAAAPTGPAVGVIGLGQMGGPIASVLASKGWRVVGWDLNPAAAAAMTARGITAADSPSAVAAQVDIVLTSLPDGAAVRAVALGPNGLTSGRRGGLIIDLSTTAPKDAIALAADLATQGWAFVDAPVSGGTAAAANGTLSVMAGGDGKDIDRARSVLGAISTRVVHCGPVGAGQVTKACNQLVVMATLATVAEIMVLARSCGLDPAAVREALLGGLAASPILDAHGARMLARNFEPGGRVKYNLKDIATVRDLAATNALELPMFTAAAHQIESLIDGWGGELDNSAVVLVIERQAELAATKRQEVR